MNDSSGKSCIIWLNPRTRHQNNNNSTIYCQSGVGPRFGNDIMINGNTISTNFPSVYNNNVSSASQVTYSQMIGNPSTNNCKILEY